SWNRLHRIGNEVEASVSERDDEAECRACASSAGGMASAKHGQKERHHHMAKDQPREIVTEVRFRPPQRRHFAMHAVQKLPVPDKAKAKHKNECYDERDEEFFPVHSF